MKPISENVLPIVKKIFHNHHPYFGEIVINWDKIIGSEYAHSTTPLYIRQIKEKGIKRNILYIQVPHPTLSSQLSFQQGMIIERIAIHLGCQAIYEVKFIVRYNKKG